MKNQENKKKVKINYERLVELIGEKEVTTEEIRQLAQVDYESVRHVIDTLSLNHTLYDVRHGVYRLLRPPRRKK